MASHIQHCRSIITKQSSKGGKYGPIWEPCLGDVKTQTAFHYNTGAPKKISAILTQIFDPKQCVTGYGGKGVKPGLDSTI
ncbi:hypothetical protein FKM82_010812 [Ascaphus truei]